MLTSAGTYIGPISNHGTMNNTQCQERSMHLKKISKYQKRLNSSHYLFHKKNLNILSQTPNQSSNSAVGGNGDATPSLQQFKKSNQKYGVDKKKSSYARYLASKSARAGYCPPTQANIDSFKSHVDNAPDGTTEQCKRINTYMNFLAHYRCLPNDHTNYGISKLVSNNCTSCNDCSTTPSTSKYR